MRASTLRYDLLAPDQAGLAAEHGEIDELDLRSLLHPGRLPALSTGPPPAPHLDVHRSGVFPPASTTPSTITAGSPTGSSHMRVVSTSTGALPNSAT